MNLLQTSFYIIRESSLKLGHSWKMCTLKGMMSMCWEARKAVEYPQFIYLRYVLWSVVFLIPEVQVIFNIRNLNIYLSSLTHYLVP